MEDKKYRTMPEGLSLPKAPGSVPMPWQRKTIYTVETEDGDLLSLGPEELANYAARQRKDGAETES